MAVARKCRRHRPVAEAVEALATVGQARRLQFRRIEAEGQHAVRRAVLDGADRLAQGRHAGDGFEQGRLIQPQRVQPVSAPLGVVGMGGAGHPHLAGGYAGVGQCPPPGLHRLARQLRFIKGRGETAQAHTDDSYATLHDLRLS
ncbi:hypothetical protein D9M68_748690 [compost metagenome]